MRSWPALETADIDGWLWRYASGGSFRANSVSALAFVGTDMGTEMGAAIHEVERRYRAKGARCLFTITEVSEPAGLDARLASMGYERGEDHATMVKDIPGATAAAPADVHIGAKPSPEWFAVYLAGLTPNRREVAPAILAGIALPRAFFSCLRDGVVAGSGLSVRHGDLASVQCMATAPAARRRGCARAVLSAVEAWAAGQGCTHLYLQVESVNVGAIALYGAFGFRVAGRYHLRMKP